MKKLLHDIQIWLMLILLTMGTISCSVDMPEVNDTLVDFTVTLPSANCDTRSFGNAEKVNTLIVGIFKKEATLTHTDNGEDWSYDEIGRFTFPISGTAIDVQVSLVKNQTYSFVFWAYDSGTSIYDIDDLTAIKMKALPESMTFSQAEAIDAFFATTEEISIQGDRHIAVELARPLAQINVGTTGSPMLASFTAKAAPDTFYPFTNTVSGTADFTWNFSETTTETFSADTHQYNYLAMGYIFAPVVTPRQIATALTLSNGNVSETVEFPQVDIQANKRSNIAGDFTE